jgi:ADP-ribose pyrophosphatase YjhB (NUDIX family)
MSRRFWKDKKNMMIDFQTVQGRFNYRTVGVAIRDEHVLLHTMDDADYWILPDGRVEFGETSMDALKREMREELCQDIAVEQLLWIMESFLNDSAQSRHSIGFYYAMTFAETSDWVQRLATFQIQDGASHLSFAWHPLNQLAALTIFPPCMKQHLISLPDHPLHLLDLRMGEQGADE